MLELPQFCRHSWCEVYLCAEKLQIVDVSVHVGFSRVLMLTKAQIAVPEHVHPIELLERLQKIETQMGRQKTLEKGPRNIDLDILLYGDTVYSDSVLSIPHKLMLEREFVLRPLNDLIPSQRLPGSKEGLTFHQHLRVLPENTVPIYSQTVVSKHITPVIPNDPARRTNIMAILNMTPDSFSDSNDWTNPSKLEPTLQAFKAAGATIIDIGGQSTRPGATMLSAGEEMTRILPMIKYIRTREEYSGIALSVDTFHASVAAAAVEAGIDLINDVSGGTMDPDMLPTAAKLGCSMVLMHMRGTPATMTKLTAYPNGLIPTIAADLLKRVAAAEAAGIFRWRMILDPGIGFAKTGTQNLEVLRRLEELRNWPGLQGIPWLVGTSRKKFISNITGVPTATDTIMGTAIAVNAAVQGGADIVRVHDVREMVQAVKMSEALYRF